MLKDKLRKIASVYDPEDAHIDALYILGRCEMMPIKDVVKSLAAMKQRFGVDPLYYDKIDMLIKKKYRSEESREPSDSPSKKVVHPE